MALGSFLSARDDVLRTQCAARTRRTGVWCWLTATRRSIGSAPSPGAIVERHVRQVAWLRTPTFSSHTEERQRHRGRGGGRTDGGCRSRPTSSRSGRDRARRPGNCTGAERAHRRCTGRCGGRVVRSAARRAGGCPHHRSARRPGPSRRSRCASRTASPTPRSKRSSRRHLAGWSVAPLLISGQGRRPNQNSEPEAASISSEAPANQSVTSRRCTSTCRLRPRS